MPSDETVSGTGCSCSSRRQIMRSEYAAPCLNVAIISAACSLLVPWTSLRASERDWSSNPDTSMSVGSF